MESSETELLQPDTTPEKSSQYASVRKFLVGIGLAAAIPILTGTAYLVGMAYHSAYLRAFRLPQLLTKTTADYFLYAYEAFTSSLLRLVGSAGVVLLSMIFLWIVVWRVCNSVGRRIEVSSWSQRQRERLSVAPAARAFADTVILPFLCCLLGGYLVIGLLVALILPAYIGERAGQIRAEEDIAIFQKGCIKGSAGSKFCNEIREGDKLVYRGFVIDGSEKYVAIYENGVARLIPVEGKHFAAVY
jgi:hypothetical protein